MCAKEAESSGSIQDKVSCKNNDLSKRKSKTSIFSFLFIFLPLLDIKGFIRPNDKAWTLYAHPPILHPPVLCPTNLLFRGAALLYNCAYRCSVKGRDPSQAPAGSSAPDKHGERLSHLATHRDNDGVRQRVCGSLSQTQAHTELAGLWR